MTYRKLKQNIKNPQLNIKIFMPQSSDQMNKSNCLQSKTRATQHNLKVCQIELLILAILTRTYHNNWLTKKQQWTSKNSKQLNYNQLCNKQEKKFHQLKMNKNLLNKEKELVLLNQELQKKNQILIDLNKELGNKNDQINNQLLTYRESSEQSDIKKSIFYQKKANELESRILTLSNDLQKQKDENQKLNQSLLYLNELQQFFDKNYIQIKSNQKNEQQLTDKVKILAKQLELSIKTKIGMDSRIQELEEFILMLLDENQDAPKASQYLNLRNRQVRRSDILKANSENQQPVSYILQGLNKQDKSIKSPQDKFTTKIQLQMQQ
eukprot:TRINITY_DN7485_c0_g1_i1.p1 TRINITY_DN7485_c0_g1~~TRINITY_DN7485_c0_g1_i1.p1  ORF type:complete len:323 (+),score=57.09 TRINITY_DN7485_c0_g1_i1:227-1195(+)